MLGATLAELRAEGLLTEPVRRRARRREGGGAAVQPVPGGRHRRSAPRCARPARSWASTPASGWPSARARPRRATRSRPRAPSSSRWPTGTSRPAWPRPGASPTWATGWSPPGARPPTWRSTASPSPPSCPSWARVGSTPSHLIAAGEIDLVINTPRGRGSRADGYQIRRAANVHQVSCVTTVAAALAAAKGLTERRRPPTGGPLAPGVPRRPGRRPPTLAVSPTVRAPRFRHRRRSCAIRFGA